MTLETLTTISPWVLIVLVVWSFIWKGMALWCAARRNQKGWFIALLLINTVGLLDILYIYVICRKSTVKNSSQDL
ncbi:MAG: hypothetical protein HYR90_01610 [Candidatus Andersenbacteria bacterium]|nr:hypothetical protein [Candidatus Andersenbacteria bacterium]MBI3250855.1 hypothetical protein [Candidatus Andersenbacteria bacterium]